MMRTITVCPSCGSDKIKRLRRNWTGTFKDQTYIVPNLVYYTCPGCGEKVYDREALQKIEAYSPAFPTGPPEKQSA